MALSTVISRVVDAVKACFHMNWNGRYLSFSNIRPILLRLLLLVHMLLCFTLATVAFAVYFEYSGIFTGSLFAAIGSCASIIFMYTGTEALKGLNFFSFAMFLSFSSGYIGIKAILGISLGFRCHSSASTLANQYDLLMNYSCLCICFHVPLVWVITSSVAYYEDSSVWISPMYGVIVPFVVYMAACGQVLAGKVRRRDARHRAISYFINDLYLVCIQLLTSVILVAARGG